MANSLQPARPRQQIRTVPILLLLDAQTKVRKRKDFTLIDQSSFPIPPRQPAHLKPPKLVYPLEVKQPALPRQHSPPIRTALGRGGLSLQLLLVLRLNLVLHNGGAARLPHGLQPNNPARRHLRRGPAPQTATYLSRISKQQQPN